MVRRQAQRSHRKVLPVALETLYGENRAARRKESSSGALMGGSLMQRFTSGLSDKVTRSACFVLLLLATCAANVTAHEMRPAYLQLQQTAANTYDVFWKVPAVSDNMRLSLYVQLPDACSNLAPPRASFANGAYTEQWSVNCTGGLSGSTVRIEGLSATLTDVLVRVERLDGSAQVTRLASSSLSFSFKPRRIPLKFARPTFLFG